MIGPWVVGGLALVFGVGELARRAARRRLARARADLEMLGRKRVGL